MKHTIEGFSQEYAITLKKQIERKNKIVEIKIDCSDLVILRWFVDFYPKMKKMIIDGKEYAWLAHKKLLDDLPLLDISKNSFIERMQKLVEFNILEYKLVKEGGTFSLYTFGNNYNKLIASEGICSNRYGVYGQPDTGVYGQPDTKDNTINNNSIINKENIIKEDVFDEPVVDLQGDTPNNYIQSNICNIEINDIQSNKDIIRRDLLDLLKSQNEDDNYNTLNSLCGEMKDIVIELTYLNKDKKIKNILNNKNKTIENKIMCEIIDTKLKIAFKKFYKEYPRHIARANAWKTFKGKFLDIRYADIGERFELIIKMLARYKESVYGKDEQYIKHPASWLNSEFI